MQPIYPEDGLADAFERLATVRLAVDLGPRTRKDVTDGSDLRTDYVYDDARPEPVALEVTTITLGLLRAAVSAGDKWSLLLDQRVRDERLGSWTVAYSAHTEIKVVIDEIVEVIRSAPQEVFRDSNDRFTLFPGSESEGVQFLGVSTSMFRIEGFTDELFRIALDNAPKLAETRPRRTHLVVGVGLHCSRDSSLTAVPPGPSECPEIEGIDWIWVLFGAGPSRGHPFPWAWWARPGDPDWNIET